MCKVLCSVSCFIPHKGGNLSPSVQLVKCPDPGAGDTEPGPRGGGRGREVAAALRTGPSSGGDDTQQTGHNKERSELGAEALGAWHAVQARCLSMDKRGPSPTKGPGKAFQVIGTEFPAGRMSADGRVGRHFQQKAETSWGAFRDQHVRKCEWR